ncbi:MAG: cupin domain-containing protein [Ewingella americana]|jgi:quercetin dioxygenase-like cupin family protein|uniref:cupin domain-containing protein n=1 Tax=Ewingella americana TaxID=41202 RepID=UPI0012AD7B38|nr:cupin domain-containing protein [Ewingella americana]MCI1678125.1 cupin domain-containing protein [Ewingella americana]MCI1856238.1 cupin domain-containing protein [Ewingella americana]MCI1862463.1 cupin domain-containing protein [Ewingella americana]MCI2162375.1 cupin domain-containing protein [Ewingella americana]MCI2209176.1 cupin domain-containing protein [Ewingella americana]
MINAQLINNNADWLDVLGPKIKVLTPTDSQDDDYSVLLATIGPGVAIPLHSHQDRETFYILAGVVQGFVDGEWQELHQGGVLDIKNGKDHAWRNVSDQEASILIVTTNKMKDFFLEIGKPPSDTFAPPAPEDMANLFAAAQRYGYQLASPEQNAAIGLVLPF